MKNFDVDDIYYLTLIIAGVLIIITSIVAGTNEADKKLEKRIERIEQRLDKLEKKGDLK